MGGQTHFLTQATCITRFMYCFCSIIIIIISINMYCFEMNAMRFLLVWALLSSRGRCQERDSPHTHTVSQKGVGRIGLSIFLGTLTGLASSLLLGFLVGCFVGYMKTTPILKGPVVFSPNIPPTTLVQALAQTQPLKGTYWKALADSGLTLAVKRISHPPGAQRKTQQHLQMLAALSHRNLMSLRAYVSTERDRVCLVYDYVPTGSLQDAMTRLQLNWEVRLKIAVGIVAGLHYLHFCCPTPVLHYNLKPANVMLDAEFEPSLTDYALAKIIPALDNPRYSDKSDVFSFGVILVFLLTGRDGDPEWLTSAVQGGGDGREALDKSMVSGAQAQEDEMLMALRIALVCLSDSPAHRPSTDELVSMLTQLNSF